MHLCKITNKIMPNNLFIFAGRVETKKGGNVFKFKNMQLFFCYIQSFIILFLLFRYAVTDRAWRSLRDMNTDQCLLFSGESGSGKTEAMKLSLQYLTAITGHAREFHLTKYQILQSNIILESFGNAKTKLNDNSSRFVSYADFDDTQF